MITPFNLEIEFCGLCLLVKHADKLHVLMPEATASSFEEHLPRIYYPGGDPAGLSISGKTVEFLTAGNKTEVTFQTGFENLSSLWTKKASVARALLNDPIAPGIVAARTVVSSGTIDRVGGGLGFWETVPDSSDPDEAAARTVAFATSIFWRTTVNDTSLKPRYLVNNSYKTLFDVAPMSDPMRIEIRHVIASEHGPKSGVTLPTAPHPHLSAYFPLLQKTKGPGLKFKLSMLQQLGKDIVPPGVSPFTCMAVGGE